MTEDRDSSRTPVTVMGLGLMGQALAGAFLRDGHPTTVWDRTPTKAEQLVAQAASLADSTRAAVAASPLVVVCVSNYEAAHEILDPLGEVLEGRVLVNLTSGTSQAARETAEWAARQGAAYLDGAIMADPQAIGTADAVILYSGPQSAFDQHESALQTLAAGTMYLGEDHRLSSLYEVAGLSLVWNILNGFLQGAALLGAAGVDTATFAPFAMLGIETIAKGVGGFAQQIDEGAYPALDATIHTHLAAMENLVHESEVHGVNAALPMFMKALADQAVADGLGDNSYAAMIEQFRKPSQD